MSTEEAIQRLSRSPQWVWTAIDPKSKLLLAIAIGSRTQAMAQRLIHQVVQVLVPGCVPLFLTDGFKEYRTALLSHFGTWVQPERRQATGPVPKPRWRPVPELLYAQVIKTTRRRRLVRVSHRVVFGTFEAVQQVLAACGWQLNTSFVERLNSPSVSLGRRSGDASPPCARVKRVSSSNGLGPTATTIAAGPTGVGASHCRSRGRPTVRARPSNGGRTRQRWRLG